MKWNKEINPLLYRILVVVIMVLCDLGPYFNFKLAK